MKTNTIILLFIISGFFIACNSNTKTASDTADSTTELAQIKNDTLSEVYTHYIHLKDALVNSDTATARIAGTELASALNKIQGCEKTREIAKEVSNSNDIQVQRAKFLAISSDIIPMVQKTELSSGSIFVLFCPMADGGKGGSWLSANKEIRNPYYGESMLDCGEVKEEIKTN